MRQHQLHEIAFAATVLADRLPHDVLSTFAEITAKQESASSVHSVLYGLPTAEFRGFAGDFLNHWQTHAKDVMPQAAATALLAAAKAEIVQRQNEQVEIVWTGPEATDSRFRHTEQAILEVIGSASKRLTVVSYAVYRIPRIRDALVAAAGRGVAIRLVVETPNRIAGQDEYDCVIALGSNVAAVASVYFWPQEKRARDDNGKYGILHVKCAVADGRCLFLSSANFTDYAFTINMELGLLVTGGKLPQLVESHFDGLVLNRTLIPV